MKESYLDVIQLVERLHRHILEILKEELEREGYRDLNNVQALILYNLGEDELTVSDLTQRGYYLGSNVSYNVKKMVENAYLIQRRALHDRRCTFLKVSPKGGDVADFVAQVFESQAERLDPSILSEDRMRHTREVLAFLLREVGLKRRIAA